MSFSVSAKGSAAQVSDQVKADESLPEEIRDFILKAIERLKALFGDKHVQVSASGHLHNGEQGNHSTSSASISVTPIEPAQELEAGEQAKPAADAPQAAADDGAGKTGE